MFDPPESLGLRAGPSGPHRGRGPTVRFLRRYRLVRNAAFKGVFVNIIDSLAAPVGILARLQVVAPDASYSGENRAKGTQGTATFRNAVAFYTPH
mgnify:CR=1 FL=1